MPIWRIICGFIAGTAVDGGAQAEPSRVPVVGRPIDQRQEEEEESPRAILGHQADAELAFESAVTHYDRALHTLELVDAPDLTVRCDLELALAKALWNAGDERRRDAVFAAAASARSLEDAERLADAALVLTMTSGTSDAVFDPELVALLEEALVAIGEFQEAAAHLEKAATLGAGPAVQQRRWEVGGNQRRHQLVDGLPALDRSRIAPEQDRDQVFLPRDLLADGRRLSCSAQVLGDVVIDVPSSSQVHKQVVRKAAEVRDIARTMRYAEVERVAEQIAIRLDRLGE